MGEDVEADAEVAVVEVTKVFKQNLPQLGVGLGYRQAFRSTLWEYRESIDFLEVIADHFFDASYDQQIELDLLKRHFRLVPHGLALSLGSAEGIDRDYLQRFASLVDCLAPPWCSDHIAFTRANGIDIGHLVPLPKTRATLRVLRDNLKRVQDRIQVPLILENITESLRYPEDEYDDAEFLAEICDQNDVGLLLDVTNLYINSVNYRFDPLRVLHRLPPDRIIQLHFVGGHVENGVWVDCHGQATQGEIWDLLKEVVQYSSVRGVLLERDENIPPFQEIVEELVRARTILSNHTNLRPRDPAQ